MHDDASAHRRRPRYKGTHPRSFGEKYKELNSTRYTGELDKVARRGQTPAGTHRPILVQEILDFLAPIPGQRFLDATLGYGGHTEHLLARLHPEGHLWGLDVDPLELPRTEARLRSLGFGPERFTARRMNFAGLPGLLAETGPFHGILADLGLSSMQIDNPGRGFTYKAEGPLDLRLNPQRGRPASALLASLSAPELVDLLTLNADEPQAPILGPGLKAWEAPLTTTRQLAAAVQAILGLDRRDPALRATLQRTFQALRIAVNDEFGVLEQFLTFLPQALVPGGRVAILTFHSGEDRRVKKAFLEGRRTGVYAEVLDAPLRAGAEERRDNPRSAPAKLRWAIRA